MALYPSPDLETDCMWLIGDGSRQAGDLFQCLVAQQDYFEATCHAYYTLMADTKKYTDNDRLNLGNLCYQYDGYSVQWEAINNDSYYADDLWCVSVEYLDDETVNDLGALCVFENSTQVFYSTYANVEGGVAPGSFASVKINNDMWWNRYAGGLWKNYQPTLAPSSLYLAQPRIEGGYVVRAHVKFDYKWDNKNYTWDRDGEAVIAKSALLGATIGASWLLLLSIV